MSETVGMSTQASASASSQTESSASSEEKTSTSSQAEASASSQAEESTSTACLKTVIVAMDESDYCRDAFDYYMKYLRQPTDYLILQHIPEYGALVTSTLLLFQKPDLARNLLSQEHTRSLTYMDKIELLLRDHGKNGRVEMTQGSNPGQEICQLAETTKARMVVLGARGMGIYHKMKLGKVADYVMHHSHVPLVIFHSTQIHKFCST